MYLVTYKNRNGEVFCKVRNTCPNYNIGDETSMGWTLIDIKYWFKNGYYSSSDCYVMKRKIKENRIKLNNILTFLKHISITLVLLIIILYLTK